MTNPIPKALGIGTLDMTLRDLLVQMMEAKLDHTVLILASADVRVSVTVASSEKTALITQAVQRILSK